MIALIGLVLVIGYLIYYLLYKVNTEDSSEQTGNVKCQCFQATYPIQFKKMMRLTRILGNNYSDKPIENCKIIELYDENNSSFFRSCIVNYLSNVGGCLIKTERKVYFKKEKKERTKTSPVLVGKIMVPMCAGTEVAIEDVKVVSNIYTIEVPKDAKYSEWIQEIINEDFDKIKL